MRPLHYPLRVLQNRLGQVPRPSWVTYLVCNRCNARCGMCDSWRIPRGYEMPPEQVRAVFDKLGSLDVVRLSGGEPFLRADLDQVAEAIIEASSPGVLHITTNGSFPDRVERFAKRLSRPKRLRVMVSFDGLSEVHDSSRGRVVSFERATETVRRLVALEPLGVQVSANHTIISRASLADHQPLVARLQALGVETQWVLAYAESSMYVVARRGRRADDLIVQQGYPLHPDLDGAEARTFVRKKCQTSGSIQDRALRLAKQYYAQGLLARLDGEATPLPKPKCVALRSHLRLLPDGGVPVCQFNTEVVGNLTEQSLEEIWTGPDARRARAWVDRCVGCWAECEVVPNALYSGDLVRYGATRWLPRAGASPSVAASRPA